MRINSLCRSAILLLAALPSALAANTLSISGYSVCLADSPIHVQKLDLSYTASTREISFNVAGTNDKVQNVTAALTVYAYGSQVYTRTFDPCDPATYLQQLCPVPAGTFAAQQTLEVPQQYASQIPAIAFNVPDLDGQAQLNLTAKDTGTPVACLEAGLTNGKTLQVKAVSYAAVGVAAAALAFSGLSALGAAGHAGAGTHSPGFGDVMGWFHSMATNGMLSVNYPSVYRSFSTNFGFSTGLVPWAQMQTAIDSFRQSTGGNLTADSYQYLRNATLAFPDGSTTSTGSVFKRALTVMARDISFSPSTSAGGGAANATSTGGSRINHLVSGIQAYVEQLAIPQANTFMTVLLIFAIVVAAIVVGILLVKVILEAWAIWGTFPQSLVNFREDYWGIMARTITNLILILYGIWVLYCIYQLTNGDSWAAKALAAVTLVLFTGILVFFTWKIAQLARKYKRTEGDASRLYEDQDLWRKYSLFYDSYKKDYWWVFVPAIVYMFAKGCILAAGDGHGLVQTAGQLIVEGLMLIFLLWNRPYVAKSSQWINIIIQIVRVLSVCCILVFVEELGISQTTKTVTGVVLIAVQSGLTGVLAILIAVNGIIICCRENPYEKRRKQAEKMARDADTLTPLDARQSLLIDHRYQNHHQSTLRKDFDGTSRYNHTAPYESYRDISSGGGDSSNNKDDYFMNPRHVPTGSRERLIQV